MKTGGTTMYLVQMLALCGVAYLQVARAADDWCSQLKDASSQSLTDYLIAKNHERTEANLDCIAYAIHELGERRFVPATEVIAGYLDLQYSSTPTAGGRILITMIGRRHGNPAPSALVHIGEPAIPVLLRVLGDVETNEVSRRRALSALCGIYETKPVKGVEVLYKAYLGEDNRSAAKRLWLSVKEAIEACGPLIRAKCEAVLLETQ